MPEVTLSLSPPLVQIQEEAAAMRVSFPALLTADVVRFRAMAEAERPALDEWQFGLLAHALDGIETHRITAGDDSLPSAGAIVAELETWADSASYEDVLRAGALRQQVATWSPLAIAGVLLHLRAWVILLERRGPASG